MVRYERLPLTRRGWAVAGMVVLAVSLGWLFGARSLNAVAAPALVALVIAAWQISRLEFPPIVRDAPMLCTRGDEESVSITVQNDIERIGYIADHVPKGISARGNRRLVPLEKGLQYDISLDERGIYWLGPVELSMRDLLGLAERTEMYSIRSEVVVHPELHPIAAPSLDRLARMADIAIERERHEFDRLREYNPTDSLRDIHWKTSAKRMDTEFIVKEFVSERDRGSVMLSGSAAHGADDALADAMASLAAALVNHGVNVGVITGEGRIDPIRRADQFSQILTHLARAGPRSPDAHADIHFHAAVDDVDQVTIEIGDLQIHFGDLRRGEFGGHDAIESETATAGAWEAAD